jgi:hypothetical protein
MPTDAPASAGPWCVRFSFTGGRKVKCRVLYDLAGNTVGLEERIFDKDGKLMPLPDGRTSYADTHP